MKKIIFVLLCVILVGCSKNKEHDIQKNIESLYELQNTFNERMAMKRTGLVKNYMVVTSNDFQLFHDEILSHMAKGYELNGCYSFSQDTFSQTMVLYEYEKEN